jgi:hypothetical protein
MLKANRDQLRQLGLSFARAVVDDLLAAGPSAPAKRAPKKRPKKSRKKSLNA